MPDPVFDPAAWTERLAHCIEGELWVWHVRMSFDRLRGLAINIAPWNTDGMGIGFLTEREPAEFTGTVKWDLASWRFFDFTSGPNTHWPYAAELAREAHAYYGTEDPTVARNARRDELCRCCARALKHPTVQSVLRDRYQLAPDFELYAGHPDQPDRNYCDEV